MRLDDRLVRAQDQALTVDQHFAADGLLDVDVLDQLHRADLVSISSMADSEG
ncbi:hypothetical protein [Bradyrhizobium cenepequi]|uniref:hypothetical protein n=1 Tax=Bradyrhizobium cenepequi TaxID=2821403 RepID=UPI001CE30352|nr:hypothetical protein [Bradyrhizobium cenepequi]MCA6112573.1 hypothetical protein [Bradyrhizobium cenepequi]